MAGGHTCRATALGGLAQLQEENGGHQLPASCPFGRGLWSSPVAGGPGRVRFFPGDGVTLRPGTGPGGFHTAGLDADVCVVNAPGPRDGSPGKVAPPGAAAEPLTGFRSQQCAPQPGPGWRPPASPSGHRLPGGGLLRTSRRRAGREKCGRLCPAGAPRPRGVAWCPGRSRGWGRRPNLCPIAY